MSESIDPYKEYKRLCEKYGEDIYYAEYDLPGGTIKVIDPDGTHMRKLQKRELDE